MVNPLIDPEFLRLYQVRDPTTCWWCGSLATTREHKFKRSDLSRMWGEDDHYLMHWDGGPPYSKVRSAVKSSQVRFKKTLCAPCNNARSQPFDRAWDKFGDYVWPNRQLLKHSRWLDAEAIYGSQWNEGLRSLAAYVVKHAACRIADYNFEVPEDLKDFLNGSDHSANIQMVLFRDRDRYRDLKKGQRLGIDSGGIFVSPDAVHFSRSRPGINMYSSSLVVGCIGVLYRWAYDVSEADPFYQYQKPRLHWRHHLPDY